MASVRVDIISIGTLSRNRLWNEREATRTAHATTTLIRSGKRTVLVDPGLPAPALAARLYERTGLGPEQVDTIFLTNFRASHRAGLELFGKARILIHEAEQQSAHQRLTGLIDDAPEQDEDRAFMQRERTLLEKFTAAVQRGRDRLQGREEAEVS